MKGLLSLQPECLYSVVPLTMSLEGTFQSALIDIVFSLQKCNGVTKIGIFLEIFKNVMNST